MHFIKFIKFIIVSIENFWHSLFFQLLIFFKFFVYGILLKVHLA